MQTTDGLRSLIGALGDPTRDKNASTYYGMPVVTDDQLLNAYRGSWIPRKVVNIPAYDATRRWREWQANQDQIEAIEAEEKRLGVKLKVLEAHVRARLWGGAAIYIGTADQDLREPINVERLGKGGVKYLTVMSRTTLSAGEIDYDPTSETYEKPRFYIINGREIHPSRFVIFNGNAQPEPGFAVFGGVGWGDSVLLAIFDAIRNADSVPANVASLVFEANVDVFGVKDLFAQMSDPDYERRLLNRFQLVGANKSVNRSILRDFDETYERKAISFGGLDALIIQFLQIVAGAADIPMTRFVGMSPSGLNSTGESDLRNYYDGISAKQELEIEPSMVRLDECLIRSALGVRPAAIWYKWRSLWQLSDKERAEIGKMNAETAMTISTAALLPQQVLSEALANQLIESGFYPGLDQMIDAAGGLEEINLDPPDDPPDPVQAGLLPPVTDALPRTLYVHRDVLNADAIKAWARSQGFTDIVDDLHVTITYSRTPVDWFKVGESWSAELKIAAGGPRAIEQFDGGAIVLLIKASELEWRHEDMKRAGASSDYPEYQPHITISYAGMPEGTVEPYQGEIVLGPEIFSEVKA